MSRTLGRTAIPSYRSTLTSRRRRRRTSPGPVSVRVRSGGVTGTSARYAAGEVVEPGRVARGDVRRQRGRGVLPGRPPRGARARGPDVGVRQRLRLLLGTGFLGAFTTYSTLAVDTDRLLRDGYASVAVGYAAATVVTGSSPSVRDLGRGSASRTARPGEQVSVIVFWARWPAGWALSRYVLDGLVGPGGVVPRRDGGHQRDRVVRTRPRHGTGPGPRGAGGAAAGGGVRVLRWVHDVQHRLVRDGSPRRAAAVGLALLNGVGTLVVTVCVAALGPGSASARESRARRGRLATRGARPMDSGGPRRRTAFPRRPRNYGPSRLWFSVRLPHVMSRIRAVMTTPPANDVMTGDRWRRGRDVSQDGPDDAYRGPGRSAPPAESPRHRPLARPRCRLDALDTT